MTDRKGGAVQISTNEDGGFEDVALRQSALIEAVRSGGRRWSEPILLYGPDAEADIDALLRESSAAEPWLNVYNFRDLTEGRRNRFFDMEGRLDPRFYEHVAGSAAVRLSAILRGNVPFNDLVEFVTQGPSGQGVLARTGIGDEFLAWVERLSNTAGLILPWQIKNSILPAFVLAVWMQRPRLRPLVLHSPRRFGVPPCSGIEVSTSGIQFDALVEEVQRVFGLARADVEKGYRVWQLSRTDDKSKPQATTPRSVSREIARNFLGVLTRARTDTQLAAVAPQKPAPLMFEMNEGVVGLKYGVSSSDPAAIIRAGAASLVRRIERLQQDLHFANAVPSSKEMLALAVEILRRIQSGDYTDADIVTLGLELNALQWHVDSVTTHLGEVSIGELAGLFATSTIFLGRFTIWLEYTGMQAATGKPEDGVAAFNVAHQLLQGARDRSAFLTPEANDRIGFVLERTPASTEEPALREGLVRSGENLAAVTAEGLSRVVVNEAKEIGLRTKEKAYEEASKAIVGYAVKHGPLLLKLGELRKWPWLTWLHQLLPS